jgi:anti-sigma factor RsiW
MNCPHESLIDDYVDGALTPAVLPVFEAHLDGCPVCTAIVNDLRTIQAAAATLPQRPVPPRVWAQLNLRIRERQTAGPLSRWTWTPFGSSRGRWVPLAAAACALTVAVGLWGRRTPGEPSPAATSSRVASASTETAAENDVQLAQQHYETAIAGLQEITAADRGALDPQTSAVLDSNLTVIDQAIDESRAALTEEPANEVARESLFEALRSKVILLQDTVALINEIRRSDQDGVARVISGLNQ